jgi:acyl carrier protein
MGIAEIEQIILKMLGDSVDEIELVVGSLSLDSVLLGENAVIDSLSLVNLIVDLEEEINDRTGVMISLTDDEAVFAEPSPYSSVKNLAHYVNHLLKKG